MLLLTQLTQYTTHWIMLHQKAIIVQSLVCRCKCICLPFGDRETSVYQPVFIFVRLCRETRNNCLNVVRLNLNCLVVGTAVEPWARWGFQSNPPRLGSDGFRDTCTMLFKIYDFIITIIIINGTLITAVTRRSPICIVPQICMFFACASHRYTDFKLRVNGNFLHRKWSIRNHVQHV